MLFAGSSGSIQPIASRLIASRGQTFSLGRPSGPMALVIPIVLWAVRKEEPFEDDHGREVLNFGITFFLAHVITGITLIGVVLWPVLWVIAAVNAIRGAVAAGNAEYFRYPMTVRFLR